MVVKSSTSRSSVLGITKGWVNLGTNANLSDLTTRRRLQRLVVKYLAARSILFKKPNQS